MDDSTGLLYARARYFSPQLSCFITKDPVTGKDSNSQSLNRYVYALNNPLRFFDPSGLSAREGRFAQYNPYASDAAYWETYYNETRWMVPWLKAIKYAGDAAQIALMFVTGGEITVAKKGLQVALENTATKGATSVYSAIENRVVKYVGITDNLPARAAAHFGEKGIIIDEIPGLANLSRTDARAVEQVLIEKYGLGKNGGTLLNKINSISQNNPIYENAIQRGTELLQQINYPGF